MSGIHYTRRTVVGAMAGASLGGARAYAQAAPPVKLTTMVFQGVQNLPLFAALQNGYFAKHGLDVDQKVAPSSMEQRDGLAAGRYQIAHSSVDNAVAMIEQAKVDIMVFVGGDDGWNDLIVQPEINSVADLRGKTVLVDAPDTAFAFQLYAILRRNGVMPGEYTVKPVGATRFRVEGLKADKAHAGAMLNLPFSFQAQDAGLKKLANAVEVLGPYLSTTGFALRSWAAQNRDTMVRYTQAYIEGVRFVLDPKNKAASVVLLEKGLGISPAMAEKSYAVAVDAKSGIPKDAAIDMEGFRNVLKLRAQEHGDWNGSPPDPAKYVDRSYYDEAIKKL